MKNIFYGKGRKIYIPLYTLIFFSALIIYDRTFFSAVTLISAFIHELGHIAAAEICGVEIKGMVLYPFGADIRLGTPLRSYTKDIIIAAAGVVCNAVCVVIAYFFRGNEVADMFAITGATLAVTNLMPVSELDGGNILKAILEKCFGEARARSVMSAVSFVTVVIMWAVSVYIFFVLDGNPSLFVIAVSLFVSGFLGERKYKM